MKLDMRYLLNKYVLYHVICEKKSDHMYFNTFCTLSFGKSKKFRPFLR